MPFVFQGFSCAQQITVVLHLQVYKISKHPNRTEGCACLLLCACVFHDKIMSAIHLTRRKSTGNEIRSDEDITSTDTTTPPTAIVPSIPPPEARPVIHKFYTRRDRNVLLIRNLGVEDKDI